MKLVPSAPASKPMPEAHRAALAAITPANLRADVEALAIPRVYGTPGNLAARQLVIGRLATLVTGGGVEVDDEGNVVRGDPRRARVLIGAHYDAVPGTPGADDNAGAVAALLGAARAIGPRAEVCFVAFNGEECDLRGSRAFVRGLGPNRLEAVHVLEMVAYTAREPGSQRNPVPPLQIPAVGDFLGLVGTHRSRALLDGVLAAAASSPVPVQALYLPMVPLVAIRKLAPHVFRSDHAPFWEAGIPALMWTDTAEFRNPHYHQPSDTPDTLDYEFLAGVARLLVHTVLTALDPG